MINTRLPSFFNEDGSIRSDINKLYPPEYLPIKNNRLTEDKRIDCDINVGCHIIFFNPRKEQRTIAPGRDFYVTGAIESDYILPPGTSLRVALINDETFMTERELYCLTKDDKEHLYLKDRSVACPAYKPLGSEVSDEEIEIARNSCCPDLVYDAADDEWVATKDTIPPSLTFPWNKAYFTDTFFAALIHGGEYGNPAYQYDSRVQPCNRRGEELKPLKEGSYTVLVELKAQGWGTLCSQTMPITIGYLNKVMLSSFSNTEHCSRIRELDGLNDGDHATMLWDPFPGCWIRPLITFTDAKLRLGDTGKETFFIQPNRARANYNDAREYHSPTAFFVNYGVRLVSNTLTIELAEIYKQQVLGKKTDLLCKYYDGGEPYGEGMWPVNSSDWEERENGRKCNLLDFRPNSKVAFTCVEISANELKNNDGSVLPNLFDISRYPYHLFIKNRSIAYMRRTEYLRLSGVCLLPDGQDPKNRDSYGAYTDLKYYTHIIYKIEDKKNNKFKRIKLPIGIVEPQIVDSDGNVDKNYTRILEFKHVFQIPDGWSELIISVDSLCIGEDSGGDFAQREEVLSVHPW